MKNIIFPLLALAVLISSCATSGNAKIETVKDSTAYSVGVFIGSQFAQAGEEVNYDKAAKAIADVYGSNKDEVIRDAYTYIQALQIAEQAFQVDSTFNPAAIVKGMKDASEGNEFIKAENAGQYIMDYMVTKTKGEAEEYMAEVDKTEGIQKTDNGIRYIIENQGEGAISDKDTVMVDYTLYDYKDNVLDSSADREPLKVELPSGVVPGFAQAIQLVGKGGKLTAWIPSELGYGEAGSRGAVGPNQVLKFDIEIVEVTPAK